MSAMSSHSAPGKNDYYMQAEGHSLHMGMSEGHYGLWLDESLLFGHTTKCETFNNQPLTTKSDFKVAGVEVWRVCY
jgi:hypothetical protein